MRKQIRYNRLLSLLKPFMFAAAGKGAKTDEEILNSAIESFYDLAVQASFLQPDDAGVKEQIEMVRKSVAESKDKRQ